MTIETLTAEEIAKHYRDAMVSVNVLNAGKPPRINDEEWAGIVSRNKGHLQIMLAKDYWTTEDLTPLQQAAGA
jgi:hypothetical protein